MKKPLETTLIDNLQQSGKSDTKTRTARHVLTLLHRWAGLSLAVFLFIAGFTGAIISWDHELDEWLNPQLFERQSQGETLPPLMLADHLEKTDPRILITWLPLSIESDQNLGLAVIGRPD
ncbi:MAG: PepSY domain-containing protein, partial [Nitrosomonas sp.]